MKYEYLSHTNVRYTPIREFQSGRYTVLKAKSESGKLVVIKSLTDLLDSEDTVAQEEASSDSHSSEFLDAVDEHAHNKDGLNAEYNFLTKLNHPGIVRAVDRGDEFIVLDYHEGDDFVFDYDTVHVFESEFDEKLAFWEKARNKILKKRPKINILKCDEVKQYLFDFYCLLSTIEFLHHNNIIHRDLKPKNVIKTKNNLVLIDFELAQDLTKPFEESDSIWGTFHYLPPEHILNKALDSRSDIYSLGIMLYHSFVKKPFFFTLSGASSLIPYKMKKQYFSAKRENPAVPEELDELIRTATQIDQDNRFDSVSEFKKSLRKLII